MYASQVARSSARALEKGRRDSRALVFGIPEVEVPDFETLDLTAEEKRALPDAQKGRNNSELASLYDEIQLFLELRNGRYSKFLDRFSGKLFHTTTRVNWDSISLDGEILPSDGVLKGAYNYKPGDTPIRRNLGHNLNAVSLWDLANPATKDWLLFGRHWLCEFRAVTKGQGILLELDRSKLPFGIWDPDRTRGKCIGRHLGKIEVFHKGSIPASAIAQAFELWTSHKELQSRPL